MAALAIFLFFALPASCSSGGGSAGYGRYADADYSAYDSYDASVDAYDSYYDPSVDSDADADADYGAYD